ncbi:MAG: YgjV family protein [Steroidobacteraceae bacterium]
MTDNWIEWLGWAATAVFVGSYFCGRASLLRAVQMSGALLWIIYGTLIRSTPVIVANVLVLSAATWTLLRAGPGAAAASEV